MYVGPNFLTQRMSKYNGPKPTPATNYEMNSIRPKWKEILQLYDNYFKMSILHVCVLKSTGISGITRKPS